MSSTASHDGTYSLTVTFEIGTDLDIAQVLVQNRVSIALSQPARGGQPPGRHGQEAVADILLVVLARPRRTRRTTACSCRNYATLSVRDELSRAAGRRRRHGLRRRRTTHARLARSRQAAARGLTPQDVIAAIREQNVQVAAGQIGQPPSPAGQAFQYTVDVLGRLDRRRAVRGHHRQDGHRAGDVTCGARRRPRRARRPDLRPGRSTLNGKPSAGIGVYQLPGANALDVAEGGPRRRWTALGQTLSRRAWSTTSPFDTTKFVAASIHEVYKTLIEAGVLVLIVILVFLQDWRAVLVPATTVPGDDHRRLRRHGGARLHGQHADAVRPGAGDRHRRRRRDRDRRERRAPHRAGHARRRDATIKAMAEVIGPDHRHHAGADGRVPADGVPAAASPASSTAQFALTIAATALISADQRR